MYADTDSKLILNVRVNLSAAKLQQNHYALYCAGSLYQQHYEAAEREFHRAGQTRRTSSVYLYAVLEKSFGHQVFDFVEN
jgi:hypothetical protein